MCPDIIILVCRRSQIRKGQVRSGDISHDHGLQWAAYSSRLVTYFSHALSTDDHCRARISHEYDTCDEYTYSCCSYGALISSSTVTEGDHKAVKMVRGRLVVEQVASEVAGRLGRKIFTPTLTVPADRQHLTVCTRHLLANGMIETDSASDANSQMIRVRIQSSQITKTRRSSESSRSRR